jgi:hypothetical protein
VLDVRYRRPYVWECLDCGRLWVATPGLGRDEIFLLMIKGLQGHGGGCVPNEKETWVTWCYRSPDAVNPWPELLAVHRLGGADAAEELRRPFKERVYDDKRFPRMHRYPWHYWGYPNGRVFY